jgi:two-component system sensor histidine kinase UhpB
MVNGLLLRLALEPLDVLERTAARVHDGDLDARAPDSPLADPALRRLARTFNAGLDGLAASRRRVRLVLARSMEAEEAERRRVARALEDDAAQGLAGLLMRAQLLERYPDPETLTELIRSTKIEIARALEVVRGYAVERRPAVLEELGLVSAVEAEARRIIQRHGVMVKLEGTEPEGLDTDAEVVLYRVLAEALDNAAQHASSCLVRVRFANREDTVIVTVEDDGQGFDPTRLDEEAGLGLAAMRERTESAGGRMALWAVPGKGTRVRFEMPKCARALEA